MRAHALPLRPLRNWPRLGVPATLALALVLFAGVFVLRMSDPNVDNGEGTLFLVPVALSSYMTGEQIVVDGGLLLR